MSYEEGGAEGGNLRLQVEFESSTNLRSVPPLFLPRVLPLHTTSSTLHELVRMSSPSRPPRQLLTPPQESDATLQPPVQSHPSPSSPSAAHPPPTTSTTSLSDWQVFRAANGRQAGHSPIQNSNNSERNETHSVCKFPSCFPSPFLLL